MKSLQRSIIANITIVLTFALLVSSASAATILRMDVPTLVEHSDAVVIGSITNIVSKVEDDGRVYSTITLKVDEALKGQEQQTLTLRQVGGRDLEADIATVAPGMPQFEEHERVLLFLQRLPEQSESLAVTGMAQGKFRIARGPDNTTDFIIPQLRGLNLFDRPAIEQTTPEIEPKDARQWHLQTHSLQNFRHYLLDLIEIDQEVR